MTPKQEARIRKHGEQLNAIFHTGLDPVTLCKKLRRIEGAATKHTTAYCNIGDYDIETPLQAIKARLFAVLQIDNMNNPLAKAVFINRDPRGYAIKIKDDYMREHNLKLYADWGGYGILAPEFDKEGN